MKTKTLTFVQVSEMAEQVVMLGRRHHWCFRIIPDFQGVISSPVLNKKGDWIYMPQREEDKTIIPKLAYKQHDAVEKDGYGIVQIIIGHEIVVTPEIPTTPTKSPQEIDLGKIAELAGRGLLAGISGIAMVSFYALAGAFMLFDPSYCVVLDDEAGTVIELLTWHSEV